MGRQWRRACLVSVGSLLAACAVSEQPAAPPMVAAAPMPAAAEPLPKAMPWPAGATCRAALAAAAALPEAERRRLDPATTPLAVAVIDRGLPVPANRAREALTLDLPIPAGEPNSAPCLLLVEIAPTARATPRQLLAHDIVRSTYRRGSRRVANPEHDALSRKLREMDADQDNGIMATGDPTIDLIGLVAGGLLNGIGAIWRGHAEGEARAALAATPSSFVEPVWEPYTYQLTTLETERSGQLRATLVDGTQGLSWPLEQTVHELHRFKVAVGRLPKDRDLLEGQGGEVVTTADVTVWERGGLRPSLAWLATALPMAPAKDAPSDMAAVMTTWAATPPRRPSPQDPAHPADDPLDAAMAAAGRPADHGGVEQVITADGVRRYRLVEPAAGDPMALVRERP